MDSPTSDCDLVLVGGGAVGATLACLLVRAGFHLALVENRPAPRTFPPGTWDPRVSAINEHSRRLFKALGAWEQVALQSATPYRSMRVVDAEGTGAVHFDAELVGAPDLGHIVENRVLLCALLESLEAKGQPGSVRWFCPDSLEGVTPTEEGVRLQLQSGQSLTARLLVGADGARSRVRELGGFKVRTWSYGQQALVATLRTERPHRGQAWQSFLPTGPLALLPLTLNGDCRHYSMVWSLDDALADSLFAASPAAFITRLERACEGVGGSMELMGERLRFPLVQRHARQYAKPGVALVGDAAHSIHPLAGQGVNLGFADASALAAELGRARRRGMDLGSLAVLRRYQRRRMTHNLAAMALMEALVRGFNHWRPLWFRWLRNTGLRALDQLAPPKRQLVRHAMGLSPFARDPGRAHPRRSP